MKRLQDLSRKQKTAWLNEHGVRHLGSIVQNKSSVKYIIENNSKEEIAEWLKNATTMLFDASDAPYFCTVYEFNRLTEYVSDGEE